MGEGWALFRLGRNREALAILDRAIEMQNTIEQANPSLVFLLRVTSRSHMLRGDALLSLGDADGARKAYGTDLDAANRVLSRAPGSLFHMIDRADLLEATGRHFVFTGNREAALPWFEQSLGIWQDWLARGQAVPYATRRQAAVQAQLDTLRAR